MMQAVVAPSDVRLSARRTLPLMLAVPLVAACGSRSATNGDGGGGGGGPVESHAALQIAAVQPGSVWSSLPDPPKPQLRVVGCRARGLAPVMQGPRRRRVVALSFDDGPGRGTRRVLAILRRARVRATFFLIGSQVGADAALVRQELAAGHALGNHTWSHPNVSGGGARAANQLRWTSHRIHQVTGYTPCVFRAPYGAVSQRLSRVVRGQGMRTVLWNIDTRDWARPGTARIATRALSGVRPGAIILMHDGGGNRDETVAALPRVIAKLRARGYGFVTIPELLGFQPVRRAT